MATLPQCSGLIFSPHAASARAYCMQRVQTDTDAAIAAIINWTQYMRLCVCVHGQQQKNIGNYYVTRKHVHNFYTFTPFSLLFLIQPHLPHSVVARFLFAMPMLIIIKYVDMFISIPWTGYIKFSKKFVLSRRKHRRPYKVHISTDIESR